MTDTQNERNMTDKIDWLNFFKPGDFKEINGHEWGEEKNGCEVWDRPTLICKLANAKLRKALEDAPVVYAQTYEDGSSVYGWRDSLKLHCTHRARLVCIEKI